MHLFLHASSAIYEFSFLSDMSKKDSSYKDLFSRQNPGKNLFHKTIQFDSLADSGTRQEKKALKKEMHAITTEKKTCQALRMEC